MKQSFSVGQALSSSDPAYWRASISHQKHDQSHVICSSHNNTVELHRDSLLCRPKFQRRLDESLLQKHQNQYMADVAEHTKGRKRTRDDSFDEAATNGSYATVKASGLHANSQAEKSRNKFDYNKRFECKFEGCGKSYSRAEHLYRHQLNRE